MEPPSGAAEEPRRRVIPYKPGCALDYFLSPERRQQMSDAETDAQQADPRPAARESKRRPAIDLNHMTVQELTALRDAAEAKRREKLEGAKNEVLAETREKLAQLGLTLEADCQPSAPLGRAGGAARSEAMPGSRCRSGTGGRVGKPGRGAGACRSGCRHLRQKAAAARSSGQQRGHDRCERSDTAPQKS